MVKDIRIELLQNRENVRISGQMLSNSDFSTSTGWTSPAGTCADAFTFNGYQMVKATTGLGCARATLPAVFVEGHTYQVEVAVKSYNRAGSLLLANHAAGGANVTLLNSTIVPAGGAGTGGAYGYYTTTWTQGASNLNQISVFANDSTSLRLTYLRVYRTAVDKSSIFGVLDANTSDDFPLSLTFSVNDPSNIDARKGAFSKTFKIPATRNNNKVLKNFNIPNSTYFDAAIYDKIPCRIVVGGLFSLIGFLQIKDVERLNDKPISYGCVYLGDNLSWSTALENKYLSDLQLANSTNLKLSAKYIIESWESDSADLRTTINGVTSANTSPIVYPLVSYGQVNETGTDYGNSFQLIREKWENDYTAGGTYDVNQVGLDDTSINNPVNDWRPLIWVYNMIHQIFQDTGYKISSTFIESINFKKLLYVMPNFLFNNVDDRKQSNTYIGNFRDASCGGTSPSSLDLLFFKRDVNWDFTVPNQSGVFTQELTYQTPYQPIQFHTGNCAVCTATVCGSGRFQPTAGLITDSNGLLQQDLLISSAQEPAFGNAYYSFWTIAEAGYYQITTSNIMYYFNWLESDWSGSGDITNQTNSGMEIYGNIVVQVKRVGTSDWSTISYIDNQEEQALSSFTDCNNDYSFGGTLPTKTSTNYFNINDEVRLTFGVAPIVKIKDPQDNFTGTTSVFVQTELVGSTYNQFSSSDGMVTIELVNEDIPPYGGVYDLQDVLPNDQKQLDFIKGIAHSFNLQFYTNESSKTVHIEPYDDFYLPPRDAIDWSYKLARNLSDSMSFIENDFTRRIIFKYKKDSRDWRVDYMSKKYFEDSGDVYPKILDLSDVYPAGDTVFENPFFAGTYDSRAFGAGQTQVNGQNFYTSCLWTNSNWYNSPKGYDFAPRMLVYNKMIMPSTPDPMFQGFRAEIGDASGSYLFTSKKVQISDVTTLSQSIMSNNIPIANSFYTSATFSNRYDYTKQFGLSYGNYWTKDYDPSTNAYNIVGDQVGKGLFERYYKTMIDGFLGAPKVRMCSIDLKMNDINKLDFRKMIYIDGVYYKLVKVLDYQPHMNVPTKVELHQWSPNAGSVAPEYGVWINNTGGIRGTSGLINDNSMENPNDETPGLVFGG